MTLPFVIGAYASHPAPELEADYYRLLADQPWVSGVEMPYPGQLATQGEVLASHLAAYWDFNTITAIPGTMQNVWKNENFGLASPDEAGRAAALDFTRALRDDLAALCERAGRQLVARVQLHSAPTRLAQADAFQRSLAELATWDWCGARLVIEHCDKYVPEQNPEKGFLSLESEIDIVSEAGIGIHLNWGRSAVEGRSADTASRAQARRKPSTATPGSTDTCPRRRTSRPRSWTRPRSLAARRRPSRVGRTTSVPRCACPRMRPWRSVWRC